MRECVNARMIEQKGRWVMARNRYGFDRNNRLMDVTGPDGEDNTIVVTGRRPIMEAMTIDNGLMDGPASESGQFRAYEAWNPRQVGSMPGGERTVVAGSRGKWLMRGADQRLMDTGFGGMQVNDGQFRATNQQGQREDVSLMGEGYAPIMSKDGRIAMSPQAVGAMGARQLMEEQSTMRGPVSVDQMGRRLSVRKQLQAQADQGFVRPGTDARNLEAMDATIARGDEVWLKRNRPRGMMERGNTQAQIMDQAQASLMTPQVSTQDGVMAGWDPIKKQIVSDASGAEAIAQGRIQEAKIKAEAARPDKSIADMTEDELRQRRTALNARKLGELSEQDGWVISDLIKRGKTKEAEQTKQILMKSKWHPSMQEDLDAYDQEINKRKGITTTPKQTKTLGGMQAR